MAKGMRNANKETFVTSWLNIAANSILFLLLSISFLPFPVTAASYLENDSMAHWSGGPSYYSKWANGPSTSADYFPIAVWLQSPNSTTNAQTYKNIGVNLHIGLWQGPTESQLSALVALPSKTFCALNSVGFNSLNNNVIEAWLHQDEPDNAQNGTQDPVPTSEILSRYDEMVAQDDSRPIYLNLGQGVASDPWYGRGNRTNHPEDYPIYAQGADILSFDIYPMNTFPRPDSDPPWFKAHDNVVAQNIWYVAEGVKRLRQWVNYQKPVWVWIETTNFSGDDRYTMTPDNVRSEVWMALIHGARGIGYFCHQFQPTFIEAGLLANSEMTAAVQALNSQITSLAPVLNTQSVANGVSVTSSNQEVPIATMVKRYNDDTYLFAVSMRPGVTNATFTLRDFIGSQPVTVIAEERQLSTQNGMFSDEFTDYEVHLYKLKTNNSQTGPIINSIMPILLNEE